jgi:hypothetical protein
LRGIPLDQAETELREAGVVPAERSVAWAAAGDLPDIDVDLDALDDDLDAADGERDPALASGIQHELQIWDWRTFTSP